MKKLELACPNFKNRITVIECDVIFPSTHHFIKRRFKCYRRVFGILNYRYTEENVKCVEGFSTFVDQISNNSFKE